MKKTGPPVENATAAEWTDERMETSKGFSLGLFRWWRRSVFVLATAHLLCPLRNWNRPNEIYQVPLIPQLRGNESGKILVNIGKKYSVRVVKTVGKYLIWLTSLKYSIWSDL